MAVQENMENTVLRNQIKKYNAQRDCRCEAFFYVAREVTPDPHLHYSFKWYVDAQAMADKLGNGYRVWVGPSLPSHWSMNGIIWDWNGHPSMREDA